MDTKRKMAKSWILPEMVSNETRAVTFMEGFRNANPICKSVIVVYEFLVN
jgi:hypothetical protein